MEKIIIEIDEDLTPEERYNHITDEVRRIRKEEGERYLKKLEKGSSEYKKIMYENNEEYREKARKHNEFLGGLAFAVVLVICMIPEPLGFKSGQIFWVLIAGLFAFGVGTTVANN